MKRYFAALLLALPFFVTMAPSAAHVVYAIARIVAPRP